MERVMREEIRCFKDDAVMVAVDGFPGWVRCSLCGFTTQLIGYDANNVRWDFDELHRERLEDEQPDPNDGALYPWGHLAPKGRPDKIGGGSKSGRKRKKRQDEKPAPKWTIA